MEMDHIVALAQRRCVWMHWPNNCTDTDYHCTIGPPVSEMGFIHTVIEIRQNGENVHDLLYVKIRGMTEVFFFFYKWSHAISLLWSIRTD